MKFIFLFGTSIFATFFFSNCSPVKTAAPTQVTDGHNSRNSLDWPGTYQGILPCADCEGIATVVTLQKDMGFQVRRKYLGKQDTAFHSKGTFTWNQEGSAVTLTEGQFATTYQVGENKLVQLDQNGNRITGPNADKYILTMQRPVITERYWKLTELRGKSVSPGNNREPHMILKAENGRVTGSGGCNTFAGTYELQDNNRISFSRMAVTKMACIDMETEEQFLKVLETADSCVLSNDTLVLNRARMPPLARFETVYLK